MASFPEDVIIDILLRLTPKSLGRSRCVSKHWNTLITTPSFIKAHLHRSSKHCHLICQENKYTELIMHQLSAGYHLWSDKDDEEELSVSKLKMRFSGSCEFSNLDPHPAITDGFNNFKLVDSFNGIVCLYAFNKKASTSKIWLWNPTINDCFIVPEPQFPISSAKSYCVGFGFNPLTRQLGDYKVVRLYYEGGDENCSSSRADIYSRRTNSWKELVGWFPDLSNIGSQQVIFEEYTCWSSYSRRWSGDKYNVTKSIVSFNMFSEEFHFMALPDSIPSDYIYSFTITLLDGCVSLLVSTSDFYEVWTMKEFGNTESWSKLYNVNIQTSHRFGRTISVPLGFASTDEALFFRWRSYGLCHASSKKEIHSYNTRTMTLDESKTVPFDCAVTDCCLKLYVESLISVSYISRLDEGRSRGDSGT